MSDPVHQPASFDPNDKSNDDRWNPKPAQPVDLQSKLRLGIAVAGGVVIAAGLILAIRLFVGIAAVLTAEAEVAPMVQRWGQALGGEELVITMDGRPFPLDRLLAALVLIVGAAILAIIALSLIKAGGQLVMHALRERDVPRRE